jgi:hypothetical protein
MKTIETDNEINIDDVALEKTSLVVFRNMSRIVYLHMTLCFFINVTFLLYVHALSKPNYKSRQVINYIYCYTVANLLDNYTIGGQIFTILASFCSFHSI